MDLRDDRFEKNAMVSSLDALFDWARHSSLWWLQIRLAYCGMEMIAAQMSRFNKSERFDNSSTPHRGGPTSRSCRHWDDISRCDVVARDMAGLTPRQEAACHGHPRETVSSHADEGNSVYLETTLSDPDPDPGRG